MSKFIFAYHGGKMPETPEEGERVMAVWGAWYEGMGSAVIDGGGPTGLSTAEQKPAMWRSKCWPLEGA